jgi:hypothetical protein
MCTQDSPLLPPPNDIVEACDTPTSIFFYSAYKLNVELPEFEKNPSLAPTTNTSGGSVLKSASYTTITCVVLTMFGMFCASIVV